MKAAEFVSRGYEGKLAELAEIRRRENLRKHEKAVRRREAGRSLEQYRIDDLVERSDLVDLVEERAAA